MDDPTGGEPSPGPAQDPGWGRLVLVAVAALVPGLGWWLRRRLGDDTAHDGLVILRLVVLSFAAAPVLMGFVLAAVLAGMEPSDDTALLTLIVGAVGLSTWSRRGWQTAASTAPTSPRS